MPRTPASMETPTALSEEFEPKHAEGTLSFWETYAVRALAERFESVGFSGTEVPMPTEATAPE